MRSSPKHEWCTTTKSQSCAEDDDWMGSQPPSPDLARTLRNHPPVARVTML